MTEKMEPGLLEKLEAAINRHVRPGTFPLVIRMVKEGGYIDSRFSGRIDCADICIETLQTRKPQVILPCYGNRVFGQTQDDEMAFTFPAGCEQDMINGFEGTHKGGIRYPIPTFVRFKPEFPKQDYKLFEEWGE